MRLNAAERYKLEDIIYKDKRIFLDEVVELMGLSERRIRNAIEKEDGFRRFENCPYCGREIIITWHNPQKKFCNSDHKKRYFNTHRKKTKISICKCCGKEYTEYSFRNNQFCSIRCSRIYNSKLKKEGNK